MALEVEASIPVRFDLFPPNLLFEFARWEVTCGFCRTRFRCTALDRTVGSRTRRVACPACGSHNLLPHHPSIRSKSR